MAGTSRMVTKMKIGMSVVTRARGKRRMYAPSTPAMAPDAPIDGTAEVGFAMAWASVAANPQAR